MSVRKLAVSIGAIGALALACAAAFGFSQAHAGHEVSYYPSFYPQEIRIEPLDPERAAKEFVSNTDPLHAYIGTAPRFQRGVPDTIKSVESLDSFITVGTNPRSPRMQTREARCQAMRRIIASELAKGPDRAVHPYPVTPFHAGYLAHIDLIPQSTAILLPGDEGAGPVTVRIDDAGPLIPPPSPTEWDVVFDHVPVAAVLHRAGIGFNGWPAPPYAKEGWFQAFHLLRPAMSDAAEGTRADEIYSRLIEGDVGDLTARARLERDLIAALTASCDSAVVGYRVRREFYNDDFSNGIENILADSQSGLNTPVFVRTVKLKDFPWNGWLRLGIDSPAAAAWNPVAGFTDAVGRLVWSTVGDNAFMPIPYNSRWVQNRVEVRPSDGPKSKQSLRIPADAVAPEPSTGRLIPVGSNAVATGKVIYRVLASAFHDGTEMEPADLVYPYALAFRWGAGEADGKVFDPEIATSTRLMRDRFRGARIVSVEESTLALADLTFTYRSPIVEVYLDNPSGNEQDSALLAPPWSSVPWHVLALTEAAVERGIAAFSHSEGRRRRVPWLDLVRDPAQLAQLRGLITEFAQAGYRPIALEGLVTPDAAKARWSALDKFAAEQGHLLVTNGPYKLRTFSPEAIIFDVVREFTYPVGLGTFNQYAYAPRAIITTVGRHGDQIVIAADVEMAMKAQRDHKLIRTALRRDTLRETFPITPEARYVIVGTHGRVFAAGRAGWQTDGRFAAGLPPGLPPGDYTVVAAVFLDGNTLAADIGRVSFRKE
jgi:hypothetical protein